MIQRLTPEAKLAQPIEPRPTPPGCMATPAGSIHPFAPWSPFSFGDLYVLSPFASMTSCTRVWRVTHTFYERLQPLGIAGLVDLSDEIFGRPPRGAVLRGLDRGQAPDVEDVEVRAVRWLADDPDAPTLMPQPSARSTISGSSLMCEGALSCCAHMCLTPSSRRPCTLYYGNHLLQQLGLVPFLRHLHALRFDKSCRPVPAVALRLEQFSERQDADIPAVHALCMGVEAGWSNHCEEHNHHMRLVC